MKKRILRIAVRLVQDPAEIIACLAALKPPGWMKLCQMRRIGCAEVAARKDYVIHALPAVSFKPEFLAAKAYFIVRGFCDLSESDSFELNLEPCSAAHALKF